MDHVVFVEAHSKELDKIVSGKKTMILRGAAGRKMPYGRVCTGDVLYFMNNNGESCVKAKANVKNVFNSDKMDTGESIGLVQKYENLLQLSEKQKDRFSGKRYLVLIEIENAKEIVPKPVDKSNYSNMDDWLQVGKIDEVIL